MGEYLKFHECKKHGSIYCFIQSLLFLILVILIKNVDIVI